MKELDYPRIALLMRRYFNQNPRRVCVSGAQKMLKPVLNAQESKRLIEYYRDRESILQYVNQQHMAFVGVREDHFNTEAIKDIFEKFGIKSVYGSKSLPTTPKVKVETQIQVCYDLSLPSDQELVEELRRRGWEVLCEKKVEKIVYETVSL